MSFQSYHTTTNPADGPPRLEALRDELRRRDLAGVIIPRADMYQGEYVADCDARLAWLTGFTGSAGFCIALEQSAGVFIDGRYRVQVKEQIDLDSFTPVPWPETKPADWLISQIDTGQIAYDPWHFTKSQIDTIEKGLAESDITITPCENLVDLIWHDRPAPPNAPVETYPLDLSGQGSSAKRAQIARQLRDQGRRAVVLTLPDSICWLLNIRGTDIPRNPIVQCVAILHADARVDLFIDAERVAHLDPDPAITLHAPQSFTRHLSKLAGPVQIDAESAPYAVSLNFQQSEVEIAYAQDPCILPKACKNEVELAGSRAAHLRDAQAMVRFLAWLDAQKPGAFTEIDVARRLEDFRSDTGQLRDVSFETIAGSNANGAIVHYRVTEETNATVQDGLLLVDSGGQYLDGTTDITRTIAIGTPSDEQKTCFTLVLKGMIAVSRARFPRGCAGRDLDALARAPLWREGLDYDHGTGHGVGVYLSVHEGPQRLSRTSEVVLRPGMILSNEPGYYREGAFGIRIENLISVIEAAEHGDGRDQLAFETLTWVPIDRRLILSELLSPGERDWINAYHADVADRVQVDGAAQDWLTQATAPL